MQQSVEELIQITPLLSTANTIKDASLVREIEKEEQLPNRNTTVILGYHTPLSSSIKAKSEALSLLSERLQWFPSMEAAGELLSR